MDKRTFIEGYKAAYHQSGSDRTDARKEHINTLAEGAWEQYILELYDTNPELVAKINWLLGGPRKLVLGQGGVVLGHGTHGDEKCIMIRPVAERLTPRDPVPKDVMDPENMQLTVADTILYFTTEDSIDHLIESLMKLKANDF